jgi:hypothetical protein
MIGIDQLKRRIGELEGRHDDERTGPLWLNVCYPDETELHDESQVGRQEWMIHPVINYDKNHPVWMFLTENERKRYPEMIDITGAGNIVLLHQLSKPTKP